MGLLLLLNFNNNNSSKGVKPISTVRTHNRFPINAAWNFKFSRPTRQGAGRMCQVRFSPLFQLFPVVLRFPPRDTASP